MQVYPFTITSFCEDFLDSLFKMKKKKQQQQDKSCYSSFRKKCFRKNEHFEYILLLHVLVLPHHTASDHALDSVEHHLLSFEEFF